MNQARVETAAADSQSVGSTSAECAYTPAASVIIPARNAERLLRDCLTCLGKSQGCPYEVIVVDDGSSDDTAKVAQELGARVIQLDQTMGPAAARNRGAAVANSEGSKFMTFAAMVHPSV